MSGCPSLSQHPVNETPTTAHLQALEPPQHTQGIRTQQHALCLGLRAPIAPHSMGAMHLGQGAVISRDSCHVCRAGCTFSWAWPSSLLHN